MAQATLGEEDLAKDCTGAWNANYETITGRDDAIEAKLEEQALDNPNKKTKIRWTLGRRMRLGGTTYRSSAWRASGLR